MRMMMLSLIAVVALAGCKNTDGEAVSADQMCNPSSPAVDPVTMKPLFGSGAPGTSCKDHTDCAALCCTCSTKSSEKFLASECSGGTCADMETACSDEEKILGGFVCP